MLWIVHYICTSKHNKRKRQMTQEEIIRKMILAWPVEKKLEVLKELSGWGIFRPNSKILGNELRNSL